MSLWDTVTLAIATRPKLKQVAELPQARSIDPFHDFPDLDTQLLAIQGLTARPWRAASLRDALGVPSILGAVTLISNTVGSLTLRALKNEVEVLPEDRPRVIVRPDPNKLAGQFFSTTAYNLATRGEFWWWIAKRDADGNAIALVNVPPEQISMEQNAQNILRPKITWNGVGSAQSKVIPNRDIIQGTYLIDGASLRGMGPLQLCGAAVSVSVEAQEWAANFYADGGATSAPVIHSAVELSDDPDADTSEAERFADAWSAKGNNRPRVVDPRVESIDYPNFNPQGAQMLDSRMYQNGEASRMFLIPGELLEYAMSGSSLTYQNLGTVYDDFLRRCLRPNYLHKIEEAISDLIPRAFAARFDTDVLTLADAKTRYDTYAVGITAGIITPEQAQSFEGLQPGDTDNAPVPFSPPQAQVDRLPTQSRSAEVRCVKCRRLLAEFATPPYRFTCKCKTVNEAHEQFRVEKEPDPPMIIAPTINVPPAIVTVTMPDVGEALEALRMATSRLADNSMSISTEMARASVDRGADLADLPERIAAAIPKAEPAPAPVINFNEGAFPPAVINFNEGAFPPVQVTVPMPEVTYTAPDIHVPPTEVTVQPAPVHIDLGPLTEAVEQVQSRVDQMNAPKSRTVQRDKDGRITGITEWTEHTA